MLRLLPRCQGLQSAGSGLAPNPSPGASRPLSLPGAPPKRPSRAGRPPRSPGPGGLAPDESSTGAADGFHSPPLPAPQVYIWRSPPPARPEKLLESWKSFRRAPRLRQKKPKTSPRPPRLPPLPLRALTRPLGPTAPHTGRGSGNPRREAGRWDLQDLHSAGVSLDSADPAETPDLRGPGDGEREGGGSSDS